MTSQQHEQALQKPTSWVKFSVPTVKRIEGFEIRVLLRNEHNPPHVHGFKSGGECRVLLGNEETQPELWDIVGGMSDREALRAEVLVGRSKVYASPHGGSSMDAFEPTWTPRLETEAEHARRLAEARRRGEERLANEPRAIAFAYDPDTQRYTLGLAGGTTLSFYAATLPELAEAQPEDLKAVAILPSGGGLRWERLDLDVSVPGLVLSLFAGSEWQRAIRQAANRQAARSGSEARLMASRENGKKGGRPRKKAQP